MIDTVCDKDLYIWHLFVGFPCAYNDKNVQDASPLMLDVNDVTGPPRLYNYTLNGSSRRLLFYTADEGYPRYAIFAQPEYKADKTRRLIYNRLQEAVRKHAEHLYAVWWARWFITKYPSRYMTLPRLTNTAKAEAVFHNMAVEHQGHCVFASTRMVAAAAHWSDTQRRRVKRYSCGSLVIDRLHPASRQSSPRALLEVRPMRR